MVVVVQQPVFPVPENLVAAGTRRPLVEVAVVVRELVGVEGGPVAVAKLAATVEAMPTIQIGPMQWAPAPSPTDAADASKASPDPASTKTRSRHAVGRVDADRDVRVTIVASWRWKSTGRRHVPQGRVSPPSPFRSNRSTGPSGWYPGRSRPGPGTASRRRGRRRPRPRCRRCRDRFPWRVRSR